MLRINRRMIACLMALLMCLSLVPVAAFAAETTEPTENPDVEEALEAFSSEMAADGSLSISLEEILKLFPEEETTEEKEVGVVHVSRTSYLNVRNGPGLQYKVIDRLNAGDQVDVVEKDGEWYKIALAHREGYVFEDYLEVSTETITTEGPIELDMGLIAMFLELLTLDKETEPEDMPALTPDGNLNLVDDIGSEQAGKQFLTVETKSGNFFYILIDRDDEGEQTVHFLNLVDETDLLSLMDEETAAEYQKPTEPEPTQPPTTEPMETEPPVEPEKKKGSALPGVMLILLLLGGGGAAGYYFLQQKKREQQETPDPDADYTDDEFELPEDAEYADVDDDGYIEDMPV